MRLKFFFSIAAVLIYNFSAGQAIFTNPITGTNPNTANPYTTGQIVDPNLTVDGIERGTGINGTDANNRYNANGWNSATLDDTDYFELTLTPAPTYGISFINLDYTSQRSDTGPTSFAVRSSIDNFTANIATPNSTGATIDLSGPAYQFISSAVTFRVYGWNASAAAGTFSINDFTFNGAVTSSAAVDWANLHLPASATINVGSSATIYARVWEPGVTINAGGDSSIVAEIGYSTTNTNPALGGFTWVNAPFHMQVGPGENDQYSASIGAGLLPGVYYYASRFKISDGAWRYGGYSATGGNFWGVGFVSGVLTINDTKVDWANLQHPASGSILIGDDFTVYAQVYEAGVTEGEGAQGANIQAWIGYSTANTDPSTAGWTWLPANFNAFGGGTNNDEYMLNIGSALPAGTYYYASRFQQGAGTYSYGGILANGINGDFWDGIDYISGVLTVTAVPTPEIDVRGGSPPNQPILSGSVTTSSLNGTLFAGTVIGNTTAPKTYQIRSTGTANLEVSDITIGGVNPGDFTVTATTPQIIAYPSGTYDFTISFSPLAEGDRTAIISIANSDSDQNPYTFMVRGTGDCATATNTFTPSTGPVGTEITITATANNLIGATVTFNGIAATVTPVDATSIKVTVPVGATSGPMVTTNSEGCSASNPFTVINKVISGCQGTGSARTQLFISEVTDHFFGSHTYVEIYNATGATVNLLNYRVYVHNNGGPTPVTTITLPSFNLANNTAYVVAFGNDAMNPNGGVIANHFHTSGGINDEDNIRLHNSSGTWIDLWGDTTGGSFTGMGNNYYYRRKNVGITAPSTTWNPSDWTSGTPVDYTDVGLYDFSIGTPPNVTVHPSFSPSCKSISLTVEGEEGHVGDNPLAYQWYYVAPDVASWVAVANAGVFSGASTATLTIADLAGLDGYQFYAQVREDTVTCYAASNAVMVHEAATVTWNGTWSPSAPTLASRVIIAATYNTVTHGSFEACSVTINPVQSLTISPDDYVLIQTNLAVNGNLVIDDSGSLVMIDDAGTVSSAGNTQILRTTDPYKKFDYTYWSSPVTGANIGTTFPDWRTDHSYSFNTANFSDLIPLDGFDDDGNDWTFAGPGATMITGKGYIVMAPTTGTFPATSTVTFSGTVNNGIVNVPLALSAVAANPNDDFNLIGNPYPSAVSATDFINANNDISGTLYFWSHVTAVNTANPGPDYSNYTRDDYALFNLTGGTRASLTIPASSIPTGYIASGQGFFVEAQVATSVLFNNAMRSKLHDNSDFFRSSANATVVEERDRIWLNLQHAEDLFSQQLIGYFDEATLDFDKGYDGVVSKSGNSISFYSFIDDDHYRIQARPSFSQNDIVPLGYITTVAGNFSISIDAAEGQLGEGQDVFIEDLHNGTVHNLKQSPYTFTTSAGTFNDRFLLRYATTLLSIDDFDIAQFAVTVESGRIGVRSGSEISTVKLYDMLGRKVYEVRDLSGNTHHIDGSTFSKQSLIVKTELATGQIITRKIVLN